MIDPRHLANLLAVAKHGSFNRAAEARGISQPALSNSIAQLERRLGVQVMDRSRRGSELNEFGRILLRSAHTLDALLTHTTEQVRLKRLGMEGPLRIGATPSLMLKFMPELMARLLKHEGNLAVSIIEGLDDQLLPALQTGEVDLVVGPISGLFTPPADITEQPLFDDAFAIAVGANSALANRRTLTLTELRDAAWVLPRPGSAYRRHVEALFIAEGVPWPTNVIETSSLQLVEAIVAQTSHVTLITELQAAMHNTWQIRSIALQGAGQRTLGIKWRRTQQLTPLAMRVVKIAEEIAQSYQGLLRTPKTRTRVVKQSNPKVNRKSNGL